MAFCDMEDNGLIMSCDGKIRQEQEKCAQLSFVLVIKSNFNLQKTDKYNKTT